MPNLASLNQIWQILAIWLLQRLTISAKYYKNIMEFVIFVITTALITNHQNRWKLLSKLKTFKFDLRIRKNVKFGKTPFNVRTNSNCLWFLAIHKLWQRLWSNNKKVAVKNHKPDHNPDNKLTRTYCFVSLSSCER